jgi:tetratricopeptide (TPR) repeat protein
VAAATAAGGLTAFAYFMVHGAVDWFWELPALGGLAFAMLGIAAGLAPRAAIHPRTRAARAPLAHTPATAAAAALAGAALLVAFIPPFLSDRSAVRARDMFNENPANAGEALDLLDRAAGLRPSSIMPRLLQGQIVVALRQPQLAAPYYRDAIRRDPRDVYSHLALAALESSAGRRAEAARLLQEARRLSPRDFAARELLQELRAGRRITINDVNDEYYARLQDRGR